MLNTIAGLNRGIRGVDMGQITDFVKANFTPAEGIDITEVEKLEKDLNPLKNITDVEGAIDFMQRNEILSKGLKKYNTTSIEMHDDKFMKEKYPELLKADREKYIKELNPEETPEQKKIRELSEKIEQAEFKEKQNMLKLALQDKAKEIGYPGDIGLFLSQGDKALETLEAYHTKNTEYLAAEREKILKELYKGNPPKQGDPAGSNFKKRVEFDQLTDKDKRDFIKSGGKITD